MFVKGLMTPEKIAFCKSVTFDDTIIIGLLTGCLLMMTGRMKKKSLS
jgi:hypothetical protein